MNSVPAVLPAAYNYTYKSALYAEVRSIADLPELSWPQGNAPELYRDGTQTAGTFVASQGSRPTEEFVEAMFYPDNLDLAPLADEFVQIYE